MGRLDQDIRAHRPSKETLTQEQIHLVFGQNLILSTQQNGSTNQWACFHSRYSPQITGDSRKGLRSMMGRRTRKHPQELALEMGQTSLSQVLDWKEEKKRIKRNAGGTTHKTHFLIHAHHIQKVTSLWAGALSVSSMSNHDARSSLRPRLCIPILFRSLSHWCLRPIWEIYKQHSSNIRLATKE